MKPILLFGGAGQVGLALQRLAAREAVNLVAPLRSDVDLADARAVHDFIVTGPWSTVINAAAFTAVDRAETDVEAAWRINAVGPAVIAKASAQAGVPIVHVSTDYVFSGDLPRAYEEDDAVGPINVYGASKEGGEQGIRTGNSRHAIIRTSWVVSPDRVNFVKTILNAARNRDVLRVVCDQQGSPTSAKDIALSILKVTLRLAEDQDAPVGTFHFTNEGVTNWAEFADHILRCSAEAGGPGARVERITTSEFPTPARRPRNSALSPGRLPHAYGVERRSWREAIEEIVRTLV